MRWPRLIRAGQNMHAGRPRYEASPAHRPVRLPSTHPVLPTPSHVLLGWDGSPFPFESILSGQDRRSSWSATSRNVASHVLLLRPEVRPKRTTTVSASGAT